MNIKITTKEEKERLTFILKLFIAGKHQEESLENYRDEISVANKIINQLND